MTGLSVGDVVNVSVQLAPQPVAVRNLSNLLAMGSTPDIIDTTERMRYYASLDAVAADFGSTAPEYLAALLYFQQTPQPAGLYIAFFAQAASKGRLLGGPLSASDQALSHFTAISAGSIKLNVDGTDYQTTAIDLSGATTLAGVAAIINTAITAHASCVWNSVHARFEIYSETTGAASVVSFAETVSSGTDIAPFIKARSTNGGRSAFGSALETAAAGIATAALASNDWYACMFAPVTALVDADRLAIAAYIEAAAQPRIYGITTSSSGVLDSSVTSDIASLLKALSYKRTLVQYSNTAHAVASLFGRMLTVDFNGNRTTITLKFKVEPGVAAETLSEAQAASLTAKSANVFVNYNNSTAIIQQGTMINGDFIDERHGLDWLQNAVQTALYNLLYTSPTKVPQTDAGVNQLVAACEGALQQAVTNGLIAPGTWDTTGFGALQQGQTLAKGYYIYAARLSSQSSIDRAARKAPPLQIAAKLAGAVHTSNVLISVNR